MTIHQERQLFKEARKTGLEFIKVSGVTDIELGYKYQGGELTDELSLRFKVKKKKAKKQLKATEILPEKAGKFKTDVLTDHIEQHAKKPLNVNARQKIRPVLGGIQVQSDIYKNTPYHWGTVGYFFPEGEQYFGITNYHVVFGGATAEVVHDYYADKLPVYQHRNAPGNVIGTASGIFHEELDYAIFLLQAPHHQEQSINAIHGICKTYLYPRLGMPVYKSGAASGITYGIIDGRSCLRIAELSIHSDNTYENPGGIIATYGDSGSVWLANDQTTVPKPVALHYAGGATPQWAKAKSLASVFASIRQKNKIPVT